MSRGKLAPIEVLAKSVTIHRKNCGEIETLEKQRRKISLSQFITQMKNNKEQFRDFADTIGAELSPTHNWGSFGHNVGLSWRFEPNSGEAVGIPEERQVYVRLAYTNALGLSSIGDCHSTPILIAEVYSIEGQFLRQTVEAQGDGEDKDQRECIRAGLNQGQIKFQDISEAALVELVKTKAKEVHWVGFQQPFAWKTGKPNSDGSWQREAKSAVVGLAGDGSCRQFKFRIIDKFHDETEMLERIVKLNVPTKASCASLGL